MKSKFQLFVFTLCLLFHSQSFASRARVLVMGSGDGGVYLDSFGNGGSFSWESPYNIFYNPAYINDHFDWAIVEKSNFPGNTAQGGFVSSLLKYRFGLYLNRVGQLPSAYFHEQDMRPVDIMFGKENETLKWGVSVHWGSARIAKKSNHDLSVRMGIKWFGLEPWVGGKIIGRDEFSGEILKNSKIDGGFRYRWGEWTPYLAYKTETLTGTSRAHTYGIGLSRNTEIAEGVEAHYAFSYWRVTNSVRTVVPIEIGVEGEVTSWLKLRGGLEFRWVDQSNNTTASDPTYVRVGASFIYDYLDFDWVVGKSNSLTTVGTTTTTNVQETADATNSQNFDITNGFFTAASVTYKW